jgi:hypothetical protein
MCCWVCVDVCEWEDEIKSYQRFCVYLCEWEEKIQSNQWFKEIRVSRGGSTNKIIVCFFVTRNKNKTSALDASKFV